MSVIRSKHTLYLLIGTIFMVILKSTLLLQSFFFGNIRLLEEEHLKEYSLRFFMEYTFSLMTLRHSFDYSYIISSISMLSLKSLHWLLKDRIDWMDQVPRLPAFFRKKLYSLSFLLFVIDFIVIKKALYCENSSKIIPSGTWTTDEISLRLLVFRESSLCFVSLVGIFARFLINLKERDVEEERSPPSLPLRPLHHLMLKILLVKNVFIFYLDAAVDLLKFLIYCFYFYKVVLSFGVPLQDIFIQSHRFVVRFRDILRYIKASKKMDSSFTNATEEYLTSLPDKVCIICRDDLDHQATSGEVPKKLKCGHCFHLECLRSWIERQQTCPTCRKDIGSDSSASSDNARAPVPPPHRYPAYNEVPLEILEEIEFPPNVVRLQSGTIVPHQTGSVFRRTGIDSDNLIIASASSLSLFGDADDGDGDGDVDGNGNGNGDGDADGDGDVLDILSDKVLLLSEEIDEAILEFEDSDDFSSVTGGLWDKNYDDDTCVDACEDRNDETDNN